MINKQYNKNGLVGDISDWSKKDPRIHRVLSMLVDHILMCLVVLPMAILIFVVLLILENHINKYFILPLLFFPFFIYLNKDFLKSKSPAKRILGYQVISKKSNSPASELQCFIRNLTIFIIWPLEVIVGLINPERRIGDFLANTKVVKADKEELKMLWTDLKAVKFRTSYLLIILIAFVYGFGFKHIIMD